MARYFFHLRNHNSEILDPDGLELESLEAVRAIALKSARDTLSHDIIDGVLDLRFRIDVESADGQLVHSLHLRDAFTIITQ